MPKFKSRNPEGDVLVHSAGLAPITLLRGQVYETEDKAVATALRGQPEVEEVKETAKKTTRAKDEDDE